MRKKYINSLFFAFTLAAFAALIAVSYQQIHHPKIKQVEKPTHPVMIVDLNGDKITNEAEFIQSQDALLAIQFDKKNKQDIFNSYDALKKFDLNKDKRLDKADPMFASLELVFFSEKGKPNKNIPLAKAGIVAIELSAQNSETMNYKNSPLIGYAIKADGTKLEIRLIPISF